jgi:hypothetical protein
MTPFADRALKNHPEKTLFADRAFEVYPGKTSCAGRVCRELGRFFVQLLLPVIDG